MNICTKPKKLHEELGIYFIKWWDLTCIQVVFICVLKILPIIVVIFSVHLRVSSASVSQDIDFAFAPQWTMDFSILKISFTLMGVEDITVQE